MPDPKEIIGRIKKIEIRTRRLVDGLIQGAYHSIFKGRGVEFSEVRPYQIGDDVRSIDWNVTARMNEAYIKEFIEERDLTIYILFDISASNEFGSIKEKKESAIEICASVMFAALRNNDKVGMMLFTDRVEKFVPASKGKKHMLRLIREMLYFKPEGKKTDLNKALSFLASVQRKRSTIFVVSDFMSEEFLKPLKVLKNRHDVIMININDPRELEIPDVGYIELEDAETGEQLLVDTSDLVFRENYSKLVKKKYAKLSNKLKKLKVDMIQLTTETPFEIPLRSFFKMRIRRLAR